MYHRDSSKKAGRTLALSAVFAMALSSSLVADGRSWNAMDAGVNESLWAVATSGTDFVVVAGEQGVLLRYDGTAWEAVAGWEEFSSTDAGWNSAMDLRALDIDGQGNIHVASYDADNGRYAVREAQSGSWTIRETATARRVVNLWSSRASDLTVLTRIHSRVSVMTASTRLIELPTLPDNTTLWGVHGDAAENIWVAGGDNIFRASAMDRWMNWERIPVLEGDTVGGWKWLAVHALDDRHVWVVGANGAVAFWNGEKLTTSMVGAATLRDVYAEDASNVWAVGDGGAAYYFDGTKWTSLNLGTHADLKAITGAEGRLWIVGSKGIILTGEK